MQPRPVTTSPLPSTASPPRADAARDRIGERLAALYGADRAATALPRLLALVDRWRPRLAPSASAESSSSAATAATPASAPGGPHTDPPGCPHDGAAPDRPPARSDAIAPAFAESDIVLIAYPDHLRAPDEPPLATLARFCRTRLRGCVSTVHVLPFHPSTSYEGYAITDYRAVDPAHGTRAHLAELQRDFRLMTDFVLNHCSASHPWFTQFRAGEEPGRRYFHAPPDPDAPWLRRVFRARNSPLLTPVSTRDGLRHVWTTYSPDLVDLDWREPDLCLEMLDLLLHDVAHGARVIRLDAFVYVWKAEDTSCIDRPQNHEILRLFQDVLAAAGRPDVALLPSITNVSQAANYAYFGPAGAHDADAREADLVYHLPLAALLLHALYEHDAGALSRWLAGLPPAPPGRAYLNLAATHDGIGLTWLAGLLPADAIRRVIDGAVRRGALLSSRRPTADGEDLPWELNTTYFSACAPDPDEASAAHADRFLALQSVVLALRGVPALYLPLFLAAEDDHERASRTGDPRAINRGRFDLPAWERAAVDPDSLHATVFRRLTAMARARTGCPSFHPEASQRVLDLGDPAVFALARTPPGEAFPGPGSVWCLVNFAASAKVVHSPAGAPLHDLLTGEGFAGPLALAPYRVLWLRCDE